MEYAEGIIDRVRLAFNSRLTDIFQGTDLNKIVNRLFAHLKAQIENSALANSRFVFDDILFMDINFHHLNLTRGSFYLPLPDWGARKGGVINPKRRKDVSLLQLYIILILGLIPREFRTLEGSKIITP